ncbi:hypothetical protein B0J17DRAFT_667590 [Rhizoctonia solani]|nr:hypothetical protein B0J17DRAFT_667590 [Rhizoctonia solani]
MQLSQHLFGAQLPIYRANYSMDLLPGERDVYTPPTLPSHVPGTLHEVVGAPSNDEIKSVQRAARSLENLASNPHLFDADLSMRLSQNMFNIQFARFMHDSSEGSFISETEPYEPSPAVPQPSQEGLGVLPQRHEAHGLHGSGRNIPSVTEDNQEPQGPSEIAQLGETMKAVHNATSDSKNVLEEISRMLTLIQSQQYSVAAMDKYYHVYKNPANREGVSAMVNSASSYITIIFSCIIRLNLRSAAYLYYDTGTTKNACKYHMHHREDIMAR